MTSRKEELLQQSLNEGGYGAEGRRQAWLELLDLQYLESQLEASTSRLRPSAPSPDARSSPLAVKSPLYASPVPLDGDGWQISHLGGLNSTQEEDQREWEGEEWSVATSKRQRRRRRGIPKTNGGAALDFSPGGSNGTGSGSGGTTETSLSRDQSVNRHRESSSEGNKEAITKRKKRGQNSILGDIEASGILLPSAEIVEDERDESLQHDWIQADDHQDKAKHRSEPHRDEQQVALDINRSFIDIKDKKEQGLRREQLKEVINGVLRRHPSLNYYQGYHDIISVLLVVLIPHSEGNADEEKAIQSVIDVASRMSLHLLRDNMTVNMEPSMGHLKLLRNLLRKVDYATSVEVESASFLPYFALPWLISLFAHELKQDLNVLVFDYILARGPASAIYISVALILYGKDGASSIDSAEKHHSLSQLPNLINKQTLPTILAASDSLMKQHPIATLGKIMGARSMLFTWSQLPLASQDAQIPTPWAHADALAEAILTGSTENIVLDALPTPPQSEEEWSEKDEKELKRRNVKKQKGASVLAVMGAVGAVGVAALLMYGAGRGQVPFL
ncbi:hypothetical protein CBS101457_000069 [Exobasidium rhododendri]|nr:hypothetical protein CBS101457_000069 [Exobasidium rhododendri]